jgi:hypothetical protein
MLRSTIIDELYLTVKRHDAKVGVAYFYCDYNNQESQTLSKIMGSLTAQLSKQSLTFRAAVWKYSDSLKSTHEAARSAEPETLLEILLGNCVKFSQIYLVLDAIDECSNRGRPSPRSQLLDYLIKIQEGGKGQIQILVTSRSTMDIQGAFSGKPAIPVLSESNSADIELYVRTETERKIQEKPRWLGDKERTQIMKDSIISRLVNKANGM